MGTKNPEVSAKIKKVSLDAVRLKKENQHEVPLTPRRKAVKVKGSLLYNEGAQAWNIIKLRREVIEEFPQLKDKRSMFAYTMLIPRTEEELKECMDETKKGGTFWPIFLSFSKMPDELA